MPSLESQPFAPARQRSRVHRHFHRPGLLQTRSQEGQRRGFQEFVEIVVQSPSIFLHVFALGARSLDHQHSPVRHSQLVCGRSHSSLSLGRRYRTLLHVYKVGNRPALSWARGGEFDSHAGGGGTPRVRESQPADSIGAKQRGCGDCGASAAGAQPGDGLGQSRVCFCHQVVAHRSRCC